MKPGVPSSPIVRHLDRSLAGGGAAGDPILEITPRRLRSGEQRIDRRAVRRRQRRRGDASFTADMAADAGTGEAPDRLNHDLVHLLDLRCAGDLTIRVTGRQQSKRY